MKNKKNKIIAISRIKDSILTISEFLYRLQELVDGIVIIDNGSTDGTKEAYKYFKDFILEIRNTEGFNEGRDRILGLELAKKYSPDWFLYLDSDELFEKGLTRKELNKITRKNFDIINFRLFHFWNSKNFYRFDNKYLNYTLNYQPRLARNFEGIYFKDKVIHSGFFYGPRNSKIKDSEIRLLHYGYVHRKQINNKRIFYSNIDKYTHRDYEHLKINCKRKKFIESSFYPINYIIRILYKIYFDILLISMNINNRIKKFF